MTRARSTAVAAVAALVVLLGVLVLSGGSSTLARFTDQAASATQPAQLTPQGVSASAAAQYTDYGDWNWFDRQTNETTLELKNTSPFPLTAHIARMDVSLTGGDATKQAVAANRAKAWLLDAGGTKRAVSDSVGATTTGATFAAGTVEWTIPAGKSVKVTVGAESRDAVQLFQSLVGAEGVSLHYRAAIDWSIPGMSAAETKSLYPQGVLGPKPGDRSGCPTGATDTQSCQQLDATIKKPVVTLDTSYCSYVRDGILLPSHSITLRPSSNVAKPSDLTWAAYQLDPAKLNAYGDYTAYKQMEGAGPFTSADSTLLTKQTESAILGGYISDPMYVVIRAKSASLQKTGPNGLRDTQSPVYKVTTKKTGILNPKFTCAIEQVTRPS